MFKTILIATDLTPRSVSALIYGRELAKTFGSAVVVGHVVAMPQVLRRWKGKLFEDDLDSYRELLERQHKSAAREIERQISAAGLVSPRGVRSMIKIGDAATMLANLIEEIRADLTVVSRGANGVLGPVSERLVRLAGRAILVTPTKAASSLQLAPNRRRSASRTRA